MYGLQALLYAALYNSSKQQSYSWARAVLMRLCDTYRYYILGSCFHKLMHNHNLDNQNIQCDTTL